MTVKSGGTADAAVGMMDSAYFTGRKELLEFFNELLNLNLGKIEQTASGAVACQLTEYIFPGSIAMQRVNWEAKSDYEYIQNYKLLQAAFNKHRVQRHVDVDKLIRGKYQDNLEFCQWLKAFYDQHAVVRPDYDPDAVRAKGKGGKKYLGGSAVTQRPKPRPSQNGPSPTSRKSSNTLASRNSKPLRESSAANPAKTTRKTDAPAEGDAALMKKNAELISKVTEVEKIVVEVEKERDFYFEKLRNVEVLLQVYQEKGEDGDAGQLVDNVFKVLYATMDDELDVNDDGEILTKSMDQGDTEEIENLLLD